MTTSPAPSRLAEEHPDLWATERVHLDAWTSARPGSGDDREVVEHWTSTASAEYVAALEALAERAWAELRDRALLPAVLRQEASSWDTALPRPS